MKLDRMKTGCISTVALLGALGTVSVIPAHAETELEALRREVAEQSRKMAEQSREMAEQRALINKLLATQSSQKAAIEKIETISGVVATPGTAQTPTPGQPVRLADPFAKGLIPTIPTQSAAETLVQPGTVPASPGMSQTINGLLPKGFFLYGKLDANVDYRDSGFGRKLSVGSGGMTGTSIALKAVRDVAPGWRVLANFDTAIDVTTGAAGNPPDNTLGYNNGVSSTNGFNYAYASGGSGGGSASIFSREAYIGMASDTFGQLTAGRQYSGSFVMDFIEANAFGVGMYGTTAAFMPAVGGMPTRLNNSIVYRTPAFEGFLKGFSVYATYTAGSENNVDGNADPTAPSTIYGVNTNRITDDSGQGYDLALYYRGIKGLSAAVSGWNVENGSYNVARGETGLATKRGIQATVNYDFGFVKLYALYLTGGYYGGNYKNVTKSFSEAEGWSFSGKVPFRKHAFIASFSQINDKSQLDMDASLFGVGYTYNIFDSTVLYVNWGKMFNSGNAAFSLKNGADMVGTVAERGFDPDAFMLGMNYSF